MTSTEPKAEPMPRVTIADVARLADVSRTTAGRALSGNGVVSDFTRKVVRAAAIELRYVPPKRGKKK
jgi:DNA-binding LacI/PurR family transcriptional regulator